MLGSSTTSFLKFSMFSKVTGASLSPMISTPRCSLMQLKLTMLQSRSASEGDCLSIMMTSKVARVRKAKSGQVTVRLLSKEKQGQRFNCEQVVYVHIHHPAVK